MSALDSLEKKLNELFVKKAPALPNEVKKWLVQYAPWLVLIGGVLTAWSAYTIWRWAHATSDLIDAANRISQAYGGGTVVANRLTFGIWLSIAFLVVEAILYLAAFSGLREKKKSGWNLIFYALLLNIAYGFISIFTDYGGVGAFVWTLLLSALSGWLLFQVRSSYTKKAAPVRRTKPKKA